MNPFRSLNPGAPSFWTRIPCLRIQAFLNEIDIFGSCRLRTILLASLQSLSLLKVPGWDDQLFPSETNTNYDGERSADRSFSFFQISPCPPPPPPFFFDSENDCEICLILVGQLFSPTKYPSYPSSSCEYLDFSFGSVHVNLLRVPFRWQKRINASRQSCLLEFPIAVALPISESANDSPSVLVGLD